MTIKDFEVGKRAYILHMNTRRNEDANITETTIEKVRRKYVTVSCGNKYEAPKGDNPYGLIEAVDWRERTYLCPSRTDAKMYIERDQLRRWLQSAAVLGRNKYTLEQLRQVKAILEPEEHSEQRNII